MNHSVPFADAAPPLGRGDNAGLLCCLLVGLISGVALELQQAGLMGVRSSAWLLAGSLAGLVCVGAGRHWGLGRSAMRRFGLLGGWPSWAGLLLVVLLAAGAGFAMTNLRAVNFLQGALEPALEGRDINVTGQVQAMPQFADDGVRFRFAVESASLDGQAVRLPPSVYLGWYAGFGGQAPALRRPARAVAAEDADSEDPPKLSSELQRQPQALRAGERWQMTVRLKAPHGNSNPYGFDYELWLWEQGLQATGYVRTGARDAPPRRLGTSAAHPVERARQSVREAIFNRVDNRSLAGVVVALVVGDQNAIERSDWDIFRATGVAHLMSISGLHITMFAWAASLLIGWLWRLSATVTPRMCHWLPASSAAALGGLGLAALYAIFSGWGVPAQRTVCMLATVVLLRQAGRQWPWPMVWLTAMAVVVVLDPWALMQAGFWLSFVAVGVLFATDLGAGGAGSAWPAGRNDLKTGNRDGWVRRLAASLGRAAREQWVVTLALTPLSLLLFNQVSLVGLLANALAIPWVTLVITPLAMAGVAWAPLWDGAAWCLGLLSVVLGWMAGWPLASVSVAAAPLWCAAAGVAGGLLLAMRMPWRWRALGWPLLLPVLLWQPLRPAVGHFDLIGADVGQGNAVIVRTASHGLVYDTGPRFSRESDAGHRVLVPLLRALDERVDVVMLSHRDSDHTGGAPAVLAMQPQAVLTSSIEDGHELQALRPSRRCVAGQRWRWDGVDFEVLHPSAQAYDGAAKSNAMSCVLRISNGVQTALLAGDIEAPQEWALAVDPALAGKLKADFLLVPHHGSKTSSSALFLDRVRPTHALVQAGYRNRFGHPVASVLERYAERHVLVVQSARCGAASWRSERPGDIICQRQEGLRYWHHQDHYQP